MEKRDKKIAESIRRIRLQHGLTQQALADAIGCNRSTISLIESGSRACSAKLAAKMADYYGVMVDEVIGHEYDREGDAKMRRIMAEEDARQANGLPRRPAQHNK